ncbi:MAG TPA: alpha-ketoacid dehydrogenase subunit beta [Chloroflexota bacterium]|jgi:pyruvate/2-oxoglutarate/acetoin dehydrogenase E1 component|nr:alpha-ketoacid dehydrogenase subunit beta [Chloroflexota bacterium]
MPTVTYSQALNMALREEMRRDERVFCLGEDIKDSTYGVTRGLYDEFGARRVVGTPISEAAIGGAALGAAAVGLRPVAEFMYMTFMMCAMDQLVNQAAKMKYMFGGKAVLPIVYRTMAGAGRANAAQHTQSLEAWFAHAPGVKVVLPSTAYDAKGLLKTAIRDDNPVVFVENKVLYATAKEDVPEDDYTVPFGRAAVRREGKDVTIIGIQRMVEVALEAADQLAQAGVEAEVIDPRTLVPLDIETIATSVKKTHRVIVVHEAHERVGFGAELVAQVVTHAFDYLDAPPLRVANPNVPTPFSRTLEELSIPSATQVVEAARQLLK